MYKNHFIKILLRFKFQSRDSDRMRGCRTKGNYEGVLRSDIVPTTVYLFHFRSNSRKQGFHNSFLSFFPFFLCSSLYVSNTLLFPVHKPNGREEKRTQLPCLPETRKISLSTFIDVTLGRPDGTLNDSVPVLPPVPSL